MMGPEDGIDSAGESSAQKEQPEQQRAGDDAPSHPSRKRQRREDSTVIQTASLGRWRR